MKTAILPVLGLVLAGALVLSAAPRSLVVPLRWSLNVHGDHPIALPSIDITGGIRTLRIGKVADRRGKDREIGENTEKRDTVAILTSSDVAAFVSDGLDRQFRTAGLDIVPDRADRVLSLELIEFWATETTSYRASVRVRATLTDAQGVELWSAVVGGIGENWGRSLKVDNYNETYSNAVFDLAASLLSQREFMRHVKKQ